MNNRLVLPTAIERFSLQQLTTPEEDKKLFDLIEANRPHWQDISRLYPDLRAVTDDRLAAETEHELRLGLIDTDSLIGWASLITYDMHDQGEGYGNWLGFWVDKDHTCKGYGTLAVQAAIKYVCDNPRLNRTITTTAMPNNFPAIKVLERAGFDHKENEVIPYYEGELVFKLQVD